MATDTSTFEQTGTQAATASTWQIDPVHSAIEFSVKHMMFATAKGRFNTFSGTIVYDEVDPTRSAVNVEIDTSTVDTRDEKRDAHIRSGDFFETATYPTASFVSTKVERVGSDKLRVTGDFSLRGITRPVVLEAELTGQGRSPWGTEVIGFSATGKINRQDFGVSFNSALETGGFMLGDEVKLALEIEAIKQ